MIVRIKLRVGPRIATKRNMDSKIAYAFASLLTPGAVLCIVVALWRLLADLDITQEFIFEGGLLSHWQVWLALGVGVQMLSVSLDRYARKLEENA